LIGDEAPISNRKIREKLGFKEEHPWRNEVARLPAK
jgi:UDP-glucose 4-epimerase